MSESTAERRLRIALDAGTTASAFWRAIRDDTGRAVDLELTDFSAGFATWLGLEPEEMPGRRYTDLIPTGVHARLGLYLTCLRSGQPVTIRFDREARDGDRATAEVRATPVDEDELFVALWDVTANEDRIRAAEQARSEAIAARELLAGVLDSSPDGFALCRVHRDEAGRPVDLVVEFLNETAARPSGRSPDQWMGRALSDWFPEADATGLSSQLLQAAADRLPRRVVIDARSASGWAGEFEHVITPVGSDVVAMEWWAVDHETPEGIRAPHWQPSGSRTDALTGLLNRGEFRRQLSARLTSGSDVTGAVVVLDLDDFGRLNDLVGAHRADAALMGVADGLRTLTPWLDLPARIGPDTFAFVVHEIDPDVVAESTMVHASRILRTVSDAIGIPPQSVSGGVRRLQRDHGIDDHLRDCDTALRHSVRTGGATVTVFRPEIRADLLVDYLAGDDIRVAVERGDFRVAYQPIVSMETGAHVGDEALVRWLHPEHGVLPPGRFNPIAEATGTITVLGDWVLEEVVRDAAAQDHDRAAGINVAGTQLLQSDLAAQVAAVLERHRLPASRLVVEITESAILPHSARLHEQLRELRQLGVLIAVDDFGSGYSSLGYLDWIPVDVVKLDMSFLQGTLDRRRRTLIAATAQLIRSLGARSLAEGIETDEQWDVVREAGVDYGQGFMLGAAVFLGDAAERP